MHLQFGKDMDIARIVSLLGKNLNDSEVQKFIEENNVLDIFDGTTSLHYIFAGLEFSINMETKDLTTIFFHNVEASGPYRDTLPNGLSFWFSQEQVRKHLGQPEQSKAARKYLGLNWPSFDKFFFESYDLNVTYTSDCESIHKISIMLKELFPGK